MAICNALSTGLIKSCDTNSGGVNKFWVGDYTSITPTISGGQITTIAPGPTNVITTTATVNSVVSGFVRTLTTVVIPGNQTSILTGGKWFYFTYNVRNIDGVTVTTTSWSGLVLTSTYDTVNNVTVITPDFSGFTPLVGQAADPTPPNTANQTVSTWMLFEVETNKNVCNFTESAAIDLTNGTTYFNQVLTLVLSRRETTKRTFIENLIAGQKQLIVVVLDSNGIYWLFGLNEGCFTTAVEGGSGTAKADANGYTITFTAMEPLQAYETTVGAITPYLL